MEREKVIKGFELCEIGSGDRCYETECPYYGQGCTESLKNDILALLKEQETIVRCKDCKHYKDGRCFFTMRRYGLHGDWFCADGERK